MRGSFMWIPLGPVGWISEFARSGNGASAFSPILSGSNILVSGYDNFSNPSSGNSQIFALSKNDGSQVWQKKITNAANSNQRLFGGSLDSNGLWRIYASECPGGTYKNSALALNTDGSFSSNLQFTAGYGASAYPVVDAAGNAYFVGNDGAGSGLIVKLNSSNVMVASKRLTGIDNIVSAACSGTDLIISGTTSSGGPSFVASVKNDLSAVNWARNFIASTIAISSYQISIDGSGNIYTQLGINIKLVKYNASGVLQWQTKLASAGLPQGGATVVVPGGVLVATAINTPTCIISYFDDSGNQVWTKQFTKSGAVGYIHFFAGIYDSGSVYLAGDVDSQNLVAMKIPYATAIPNGTYGSWTVSNGIANTTTSNSEIALSTSFASSTPTTTTTTPTVSSTALTFSNTVL